MLHFEKAVLDFIRKRIDIIFLVVITILALIIRYTLLDFKSGDYRTFLEPWFNSLKSSGGLSGLATYTGDYNYPYITILSLLTYLPFSPLILIKILSIIFDFALAFTGLLIVKELVQNRHKKLFSILIYSVLLFLPTVILNGSMWAQCDAIYTTFIFLAILFFLKDKIIYSFVSLGLAFAFKLQFIFILPFFIFMYMSDKKKRISFFHFLIIPVINIILCLPAFISGVYFWDILTVYFKQTQTYSEHIVLNLSNIYMLFPIISADFYNVTLLFTTAIFGILLFYFIKKSPKWSNELIISSGLLSIMLATYLLPGMHDRYLYAADVLSVIWFAVYKKQLFVPIAINLVSLVSYLYYLSGGSIVLNYQLFSILFFIAIIMMLRHINELTNQR